jgi:Cu/Ag efflux protein CusF
MSVLLALTIGVEAKDTAPVDTRVTAAAVAGPHQAGDAKPHEGADVFHGIGFVTAIEPAGSLTISHQPIEGLMPAMEMMFSMKPRALAQGIRPGDQIEFSVEGKTYSIVGVKVVGHVQ